MSFVEYWHEKHIINLLQSDPKFLTTVYGEI